MGITICPVGGYSEVGKNMTAIKVDDSVFILDMGLYLDNYIKLTEEEELNKISADILLKADAVPDITKIADWKDKVKAIIPTHAHLDHLGGIPFIAEEYDAPVICTPYSAAVLKAIIKDDKIPFKNKIMVLSPNSKYTIGEVTIEFIHITHSTPQTVMVALHTKYGIIIYANDFKFDASPVLGKKANIERLRELGDTGNVLALICESTYALEPMKTPSESVAREMLKDVLLHTDSKGKAVIVSTFSSHIARLKSIVEFGKKMNRRVVFIGRSLSKYVQAAEDIKLVNFSKDVIMVRYGGKAGKMLKKVMQEDKSKFLLVVTGHQGEPKSILSRMVHEGLGFKFDPDDQVIFSCRIIPTETNEKNRAALEEDLKKMRVRIFRDIHVSGHAAREDLRDTLKIIRPKHLIPSHGEVRMTQGYASLAYEMGYSKENVHLVKNGSRLKLI